MCIRDRLTVGDTSFNDTALEIRSSSSTGRLYFTDSDSAGVGAYMGAIQYHHTDDSMKFETGGGTLRLRIDSDGLKFGSDTATANGLNDYERGLWTPTITGGGTSISYGNRRAWYVKIGEFVHASFYITFSAQGDGNQFVMGGLPFTSNYDSPISYNSGGNLSYKDCAFTNNAEQRLYVGNNGANIYFYHNASDPHSPAGSIITTTSVITSSLYGFVAYQTDS